MENERTSQRESERLRAREEFVVKNFEEKENCSNNKILFVCLERKRGRERERVRVCVKEGM